MSYRFKETEKVNDNFMNQQILMYIRYYTTFNLLFLSECINDVFDLGLDKPQTFLLHKFN